MISRSGKKQDRDIYAGMLRTLSLGNYVLVRFMNHFRDLSAGQQVAFVAWFHEKVGDDRWDKVAADQMLYGEFIKALIMHHSGSEVKNEPSLKDLEKLIGEYCKSDEYEEAYKEKEFSFTEQLEEL